MLTMALSGCATIMSGTTERIRFESIPPGAHVVVDGRTYTTPVEVALSRARNHEVEFQLQDHLSAKRQVLKDTNSWLFGNILIGGLIGLMVDYSSGASNDLQPDVVTVQLMPKTPIAPSDPLPTFRAPSPMADGPATPPPQTAPADPP